MAADLSFLTPPARKIAAMFVVIAALFAAGGVADARLHAVVADEISKSPQRAAEQEQLADIVRRLERIERNQDRDR